MGQEYTVAAVTLTNRNVLDACEIYFKKPMFSLFYDIQQGKTILIWNERKIVIFIIGYLRKLKNMHFMCLISQY